MPWQFFKKIFLLQDAKEFDNINAIYSPFNLILVKTLLCILSTFYNSGGKLHL